MIAELPEGMTPAEYRLAVLAAEAVAALPDDVRAECELLADLDPESRGIRVRGEGAEFVLSWVGRDLARAPWSWLRDGATP